MRPASPAADDGLDLPALRRRRPAARAAAARPTAGSSTIAGQVEVISSARARRPAGVPRPALGRLRHVRGAAATTSRRCFAEYGLVTDPSGRYTAMYKPYHLIGLELGITRRVGRPARRADRRPRPASAATSSPPPSATSRPARCSTARAASRVCGKLMPAADSLRARRPADRPRARRHADAARSRPAQPVRWSDVAVDETVEAVRVRREMETMFRAELEAPRRAAE